MKEKKHIQGFKVPEDYFLDFEEKMLQRISEKKLPNDNGFAIPENYFDTVEAEILQKIIKEKPSGKLIKLNSKRLIGYAAAIAACAVLIFSLSQNDPNNNDLEDLPYANIENYIEEGNLDMSTYDVLALLDDATVNDITPNEAIFEPDVLEEYILETTDEAILTEER